VKAKSLRKSPGDDTVLLTLEANQKVLVVPTPSLELLLEVLELGLLPPKVLREELHLVEGLKQLLSLPFQPCECRCPHGLLDLLATGLEALLCILEGAVPLGLDFTLHRLGQSYAVFPEQVPDIEGDTRPEIPSDLDVRLRHIP